MAHRAPDAGAGGYDTVADRDELVALIAGRGYDDCEAARILAGQAYVDLFRDGDPALRPAADVADPRSSGTERVPPPG
jgi:hypothetical protein